MHLTKFDHHDLHSDGVDPSDERLRLFRRLVWTAWGGGVLGNYIAVAMCGVLFALSLPVHVSDAPNSQLLTSFVSIVLPLEGAIALALWPITREVARDRVRWFLEGVPPTEAELDRLVGIPRFMVFVTAIVWTIKIVVLVAYFGFVSEHRLDAWALSKTIAATYLLGFAFGTVFGSLAVERAFRPYAKLILPRDVADWPPSIGLAPRLLVLWFAVAGAPLLLISFTWIGLTQRQQALAASALRITSLLAVLVGLLAFVIAGRTITVPLRHLQEALRRVGSGDLTAHVEVDDAGEVGHLQIGFNHMVDGLKTLVSDNERLQERLRAQLAEVQASRVRIVEAADAERARIERNLHDGAQQRLLSVAFAVRAAERSVREGNPGAGDQLQAALCELDGAMAELRELARGIHPAILEEEGLGPALSSLADRAAVPVELNVRLSERLPTAVEVTAYFVVAEALTNIAKYADASTVTIEATEADGVLRLCVCDDGKGGADPQQGSGLRGLVDRISALGGSFEVDSREKAGTRVMAAIPCS